MMQPDDFAGAVLDRLEHLPEGAAICVGFSGGLDSTVLLHVLAEDLPPGRHRVSALHVNHGISPNADAWQKSCERFCANHGVPLAVERVRLPHATPEGLEAAARTARYAVYASRSEPYLALAHHRDDQAETVMLQLLRGTGLRGIAAMPELRKLPGTQVQVFRPLLNAARGDIHAYAVARGLRWIEDESNASKRHDRNYLRHDVLPLLDARFGAWREALVRFARHAGAAGELLDALATIDGAPAVPGETLALAEGLDDARRANALRAFLARNAVAMPSEARLAEMVRQLFRSRGDARVRIEHAGVVLTRHRGEVFIERDLAPLDSWSVPWRGEPAVELGSGRGSVVFASARGEGLRASRVGEGAWRFGPREGGETLRPDSLRPTRTLKNLLQEKAVPDWQRERLPLLFHGERLVWAPGIGVDADYACGPGEEGLAPLWTVAGKAPL
jgi:tRNA(Ile)-lysidine synthase